MMYKILLLNLIFISLFIKINSQVRVPNDGTSPIWYYNNNVGINTTIPLSKLQVNTSEYSESMQMGSGLGSTFSIISANGLFGLYTGVGSSGNVWMQVGRNDGNSTAYNLILQPNGGNIGIGTTTPGHKLEIKNGDLYLNNTSADGGTLRSYGHFMDFKGTSETSYAHRYYRFYPSPGFSGPTYSYLKLYTGTPSGLFNENVSISSSGYTYFNGGNVGIGVTEPLGNLHIGKQEVSAGSSGEIIRLVLQPYGHTGGPWNFVCRDVPESAYLDISYNSKKNLTIHHNGNVGIGTTDPKNLLDVKGTIHAQEVKVDMNNWSDFVFHPSYQLKPLTEVEKFIKANGHLHDIPSAAQVEQNGVNVGEMQKKLLQKVEELTLYVIELEKKIEQQNKTIEQLNKK